MDSERVIASLAKLLNLSPGLDGPAGKLMPFEELPEVGHTIVRPAHSSSLFSGLSTWRPSHPFLLFHTDSSGKVQDAWWKRPEEGLGQFVA